MKSYPHIASRLYCDTWGIRPDKFAQISAIFEAHVSGRPRPGGAPATLVDMGDGETEPVQRPSLETEAGVGIIEICGVIGKHLSSLETMCGGVDLAQIDEAIEEAAADSTLRTVIFSINSPGGATTGMPETAARIAALGDSKHTIAYFDMEANSCGYWLASQCREVICAPSANGGCIGAFIAAIDSSRAWENEGYKRELFTSGEFKGMGVEGKPFSDQQKAFLQSRVDSVTAQFKAAVKAARPQVADALMDGRFFSGSDLKALGMVDDLAPDLMTVIKAAMSETLFV